MFFKIKDFILDLIFPIHCLNCGAEGKKFICDECFEKIPIIDYCACPICERLNSGGETCAKCKKGHFLDGLFVAAEYDNPLIRKIIKTFKFKFIPSLSEPLASLIMKRLDKQNFCPQDFDIVIPVPLHKRRLNWRGFNQSELIAQKLSEHFNIPMNRNILVRIKNTKAQSKVKTGEERKRNIEGAFFVIGNSLPLPTSPSGRERSILLIDDVCSTASTLNECAKVLKQAGAKKVWGIVAARGK